MDRVSLTILLSLCTLTILLSLCSAVAAVAQPRESVRVVSHSVTQYERGRDTEPGFELRATYPELRVRHDDSALRAFRDSLHRAVTSFTGGITEKTANGRFYRPRAAFDEPFENTLTYESYISDSVISITLLTYEHGCCGASGSAEGHQCFNFDRSRRRVLRLGDVIRPEQESALRALILEPANRDASGEIFDADSAKIAVDARSTDFSITDSSLVFYVPRSGGGRSWYMAVGVPILDHPEIFTPLLLRQKRTEH